MWLLNYRGGSVLPTSSSNIVREARLRNVRVETISASEAQAILREVENPGANMAVVNLESVPSIAVYTPPGSPTWDDDVTLALDYAAISYYLVYDPELIIG